MIKKHNLFIVIIFIFSNSSYGQPAGYSYGKQILVQASQVSGTSNLTNFTVLVSLIDPNLRTVSNGGHVQNANGYDIIFTLGDCITQLNHQIEQYDPLTGKYIAWVRIPSLPATTNYGFHMYYGNTTITINPSSTATWNSDVRAVYHLSNNDFNDGTSNVMHGTNYSTGSVVGQIGGGRSFNGSSQYINVSESGTTSLDVSSLTMSAWVYPTDYDVVSDRGIIVNKESIFEMGLQDNVGALQAAASPVCWRWAGTGVVSLNTWSKVTVVFASGVQKNYINGSLVDNLTGCSNPLNVNDADMRIGARGGDGSAASFFKGNIDEVKIVGREETADWIATEYNNQKSPSTFYSVSSEMAANTLCIALPIELFNFNIELENRVVHIKWTTVSEKNNDFFSVERSSDGLNWEEISRTKGAGNSSKTINYSFIDITPLIGVSYYRIKQIDFDGKIKFSDIKSIEITDIEGPSITIYPNPAQNQITITGTENNLKNMVIYDIIGRDVMDLTKEISKEKSMRLIDISNLNKGVYWIVTKNTTNRVEKY